MDMTRDIITVICFVMIVIIACVAWNSYAMRQDEKTKQGTLNITYDFRVEALNIVGEGNDQNGDYDVSEAIEQIKMPDDIRIKINE